MVPRRANEVELDINLFSSSQIMRDGAEPEGAVAASQSWPRNMHQSRDAALS